MEIRWGFFFSPDSRFKDFLRKRQETALIWKTKGTKVAPSKWFLRDVSSWSARASTGGKTASSFFFVACKLLARVALFAPAVPQSKQPVVVGASVAAVTFPLALQNFVSVPGRLYTTDGSKRWHDSKWRTGQVVCVDLTTRFFNWPEC